MGFPVRLKHFPTLRDYSLTLISYLVRAAGVSADQVRATHETSRHPSVRETVEFRGTAPDKNTVVRSRLFNDLLNNGKKIERPFSHCKRLDEKTDCRQRRCRDNGYSDPSPALRGRALLLRDKS